MSEDCHESGEDQAPKLEEPQGEAKPDAPELPWARITVRQMPGNVVKVDREYHPKGQCSPDVMAHAIMFNLCEHMETLLTKEPAVQAQESIKAYTGPRGLEEMTGPSDATH
ncbi:MAG: hypothetical protein HY348_06405 [Nitrospira defluvii]|nr:hypothetical protein [Nitrospira defluvii]